MNTARSKSNLPAESRHVRPNIAGVKDDLYPGLDIRMHTAKGIPNLADGTIGFQDIHMNTIAPTVKAQPVFKPWERQALDSNEVKRKATVAQLCTCSYSMIISF